MDSEKSTRCLAIRRFFGTWQPVILCALFLLIFTWPVLKAATQWCYAYYDAGIYGDALGHLSLATPNPWLDARQIRIFNDHFDPILWLGTPGVWLGLSGVNAGIVTESLFVLLSTIPIFALQRSDELSPRAAALLVALLIFNTAVTEAVTFPFHPTTWAMAPMFWLGTALCLERYTWVFVSFLILCACKEEFPFVGLMVSVVLLRRSQTQWAIAVLFSSLIWLTYALFLRSYEGGTTSNYGQVLIAGFFTAPLAYLKQRFTVPGMWSRLGSFTATFTPLLIWAWRKRVKIDWWLLLLLLPVLAIRFLGMSWRGHYNACLLAGVVATFLPIVMKHNLPRWVVASTLIVLVTTNHNKLRFSASTYTKWPPRRNQHCPPIDTRLDSINRGAFFLDARTGGPVLVGQNLLLPLRQTKGVFVLGGPQKQRVEPYRYVFVEKPPYGVAWPYDNEAVSAAIDIWRSNANTTIIYDDDYIFLAQGSFVDPTPLNPHFTAL